MSNKQPTNLSDDAIEQIQFNNRIPQEMTDEVFAFVRGLVEPMSDEEFFALRVFWQQSFDFFKGIYATTPEVESAFQFFTLCLSATNHRAREIAPLPDSAYPTVGALKAENETLKTRVAELEAIEKSSIGRSLLDKVRGKVVWDKDRFPEIDRIDRRAFEEILDEITRRKARAKVEDARKEAEERLVDAKARADAKVEEARSILEEREIQLQKDKEAGRIIYRQPVPTFNTAWEQVARARHDLLVAELEARVVELESQLDAVTIEAGFYAERIADSDQEPS